ncbi:hypothetical protein WJX74_010400 [Apatococcus lobatus]
MHLIDPSRDYALMNKTEDALLDEHKIPTAFFSPPFKGMYHNSKLGRWQRVQEPYQEKEYVDQYTRGQA